MVGCRPSSPWLLPAHSRLASVSRSSLVMAALLVALVSLATTVSADCECGYSTNIDDKRYTFTDLIETDFAHTPDISTNTDWIRQAFNITSDKARGSFGEMFAVQNIYTNPNPSNVRVEDGNGSDGQPAGLQLIVKASQVEDMVPVAEIDTNRTDVIFGSFRTGLKLTDVPGTCSAFFWYFNDTQEIDMEFLSKDFNLNNNSFPVNLVLQSREAAEQGYNAQKTGNFVKAYLPFNPTLDFHEYRIDFLPGRVRFYADNQLLANMKGPAVPDHSGHLVLQHWSNGNRLWSAGPPSRDAVTTVAYVKAYFNSSLEQRHQDWENRCPDPSAPGAICRIPEPSPTNSTPTNWFFSYQNNMTNNQTVSGKDSEASQAQIMWWSLLPTLLVTTAWLLDIL